jgi:alkaline phosphatase D
VGISGRTLASTVDRNVSRRGFLAGAGAAAAVTATRLPGAWAGSPGRLASPFTLGVASGDPAGHAVVLWTRLAPEPLHGGGMPSRNVAVEWQVAADEKFSNVVRRGTATARPEHAHSVHVDVRGLRPGRPLWYRFKVGGEISPVGRTKPTPGRHQRVNRMRFAFASCQQFEHGYFTAYRHMANDDLDLVVHLGDYIYEYGPDEYVAPGGNVRRHRGSEIVSLADYRNRLAQYKRDPDLQAAHAAFPWVFTWDDHEVENDYADEDSEDAIPTRRFLRRRANAYKAYWEHMPLRPSSLPQGPNKRIYRRLRFGDLALFSILDTRQYRDDQACPRSSGEFVGGGQVVEDCAAITDPERTMLGPAQERWLLRGLGRSEAHWNVIAQQFLMAYLDEKPGPGTAFWTDDWNGYQAARRRILSHLHHRRVSNPIVIGGDIHSYWATDLKANFREPASPTIASEFVGTSITSANPPPDLFPPFLPDNPHIKYFDGEHHGYVRCDLNRRRWRSDFEVVEDITVPRSGSRTLASFEVESGNPGVQRV